MLRSTNLRVSAKRRTGTGPIRVCFLIDRLSRAGTETQLLALIRSLDRSRIVPHLVLLDGDPCVSRSLEPADCPILRLGLRSLLGRTTIPAMVRLSRFWRQHRVDIVQTYFLDSTYFGVPLARLCGIRKIVRVRNNLGHWLTNRHRRLGRWMGRLADVTLTNSESGKQSIIEAEGLHPEKITVLENGVDLDRFPIASPPNTAREIVRIGAVANLRPVKNINGLIRVAADLRESLPQLRFEVAGEGEQRAELERLIVEHRLEDRFRLLGTVDDISAFLAKQDIAVLCSHSEGMSNALLEYMASGRAIVATDVGANRRLVTGGIHGRLVPPKDERAIVMAIADMLIDPDHAMRMGIAARHRVETEFSRSAMVKCFEQFYGRMISV